MKNNQNAFSAQLRRLEQAERKNGACFGHILNSTARMIAFSVLNKLCRTGAHTEILNDLRRDIMSGDGDGLDLVQCAALSLLEEINKAHERHGETLPDNWTEETYTQKTIDKRVMIQTEDSAKWIEKDTCPITQAFRAVRDCIQRSRGVQLASLVYSYIEDYATDETGAEEQIYKRIPKYRTEIDENGTTKQANTEYITETVNTLNLTGTQAETLRLRLRGYGYKAIASYTGKSKQAVQKTMKQIQTKALAIGLNAGKWIDETEPETMPETMPETVNTSNYCRAGDRAERAERARAVCAKHSERAAVQRERLEREQAEREQAEREMYMKMK